jgi:plasmid maintenance system antidote protein VapI
MRANDLTDEEQKHVRTAIRYLRRRCWRLEVLAKQLAMRENSLSKILRGSRSVTARVAVRVARFAGVTVDDLFNGRGVPAGTCPFCGHPPDEVP